MRSLLSLRTVLLLVVALLLVLPATITAAQNDESWATYSEAMHSQLVGSSRDFPGLYFTDSYDYGRCDATNLPSSIYERVYYSDILDGLDYDVRDFIANDIASSYGHLPLQDNSLCSYFVVDFTAELGPTFAGTAVIQFESEDDASAAFDQVSSGLVRTGWLVQKGDDVDHDHTCATLVVQAPSLFMTPTAGLCGVLRDNAILIGATMLPVEAPEAALQNAVDLAQLMNKAYDEVDRPE